VKISITATAVLFSLTFTACSALAQPTPTPAPTRTSTPLPAPTRTASPPTETPAVLSRLEPQGEPASEWNGIPVMAAAIAGDGDEESYVFNIKATPQEVQAYYQSELGKLGWQMLAQGTGDSSLMLIFTDASSATLTVSIITKGDQVLVLLVK
jgi:hypothetical protein